MGMVFLPQMFLKRFVKNIVLFTNGRRPVIMTAMQRVNAIFELFLKVLQQPWKPLEPQRISGQRHHFIFTKNVLPSVPVKTDGDVIFKSPHSLLDPAARTFNLEYLVPFGTLLTCYIPEESRVEGKSPSQKRSFQGAMLGYTSNMCAKRVWDIEKRKRRDISFVFTFVHEGFFPFQNKKNWPEASEGVPIKFYPTREAVLDEELGRFGFDRGEEEEVRESREIFRISLSDAVHSEYPSSVPVVSVRPETKILEPAPALGADVSPGVLTTTSADPP